MLRSRCACVTTPYGGERQRLKPAAHIGAGGVYVLDPQFRIADV